MNSLLNGKQSMQSTNGSLFVDNVRSGSQCRHSPELVFRDLTEKIIWTRTLEGLEENSASEELSSFVCDFAASIIGSGSILMIAGNNRVIALDLADGRIISEEALIQTDSSLDILELHQTESGKGVVVSARRIVLVNNDGQILSAFDLKSPVVTISQVTDKGVVFKRYETENTNMFEVQDSISFR